MSHSHGDVAASARCMLDSAMLDESSEATPDPTFRVAERWIIQHREFG